MHKSLSVHTAGHALWVSRHSSEAVAKSARELNLDSS